MKKVFYILLLVLATLSFISCEFKLRANEDDDQNSRIEIRRYDRLESRYLTTGDFSALQQMNIEYPIETRTLIEKVLIIGSVEDPEISNKFLRYYQDSTLQSLIADSEAEFANIDDINTQLERAVINLQKFIPNIPIPMFYAQIGSLDQSIVVGDKSVGINIDKYLGKNYSLYKKYYSSAQTNSMDRSFIVPDCLCFYLLSLYPMENYDIRPQIDKDLHMGKVMWVVNKSLGTNFFKNKFVSVVDKYMKKNKQISIPHLLTDDDFKKMY